MTIDLGGLTAKIESFPGHSGADLIVRVPGQNVVYTGDLLFSGYYPYGFDQQAGVQRYENKSFTIKGLRRGIEKARELSNSLAICFGILVVPIRNPRVGIVPI
jgi:glyoxylase-like metal-dependent hydrolase (beta-lactamase superfamily II)